MIQWFSIPRWFLVLALAGVFCLLIVNGPVSAQGQDKLNKSFTFDSSTIHPESNQIVMDREALKEGVPVEEIENPMAVTGAGLELPDDMTPREYGNQRLDINNMDVDALNELLETRNFFTKVASLAGKVLNNNFSGPNGSSAGNVVKVNRLDNLSLNQVNQSLSNINIPANIDVSSIDPSSSLTVLESVNISINETGTSVSVTTPE